MFRIFKIALCIVFCVSGAAGTAQANQSSSQSSTQSVVEFASEPQRQLYQKLIAELRCLVCQNQNIADSNAELAQDLRQKTAEMVTQGKTYDHVIAFMVERYGDFVVYRPPLKAKTLFLWFAPFALIIISLLVLIVRVKQTGRRFKVTSSQLQQESEVAGQGEFPQGKRVRTGVETHQRLSGYSDSELQAAMKMITATSDQDDSDQADSDQDDADLRLESR